MFVAGIALFAVASPAVGLAQSPAWMIVGRAVQGIGAAILAPATLAPLSTSFPEGPERARAMGAYGALAGIGTAAGLIIGGALTDWLSWRVGFFINVPVAVAAILAAPRHLPETDRHPGRLDAAGALSSTAGASALVYGIVRSADAGWGDATTLVALLAGTVWLSRVSVDTGYLTGIALPMIVFGIGQGLGLSTLTTAGMAGVAPRDAGVAGGLVNVAHHLGGALGLGVLVTVFDAAGAATDTARELLAHSVSASLAAAAAFMALALLVTIIAHPRGRPQLAASPNPHRRTTCTSPATR